jgi:hypothetical protein
MKLIQSSSTIAFDNSGTPMLVSPAMIWTGRVISALAVLFLLFDSLIKVFQLPPAIEATVQLGYQENLVLGIGLLELACLAIYVVPRTSIFGAILLTGYLGGAIATHVQNGSDMFSLVFPALVGGLVWAGLYVRDRHLRFLVPFRR